MLGSPLHKIVVLVAGAAAMASFGCGGGDTDQRAWSPATLLDGAGGDVHQIDIAMNARGDAIAVWDQSPGAEWNTRDYSVWAARFTPDGDWSAPVRLSAAPGDRGASAPAIAINATGYAVAAWRETGIYPQEPDDEGIWVARFDPATGWEERAFVGKEGHSADVALNDAGQAVVVWGDFAWTVRASHLDAQSRWSDPTRLDRDCVFVSADGLTTTIGGDANAPNVGIDERGQAIAVWDGHQSDDDELGPCNEDRSLFARRFSPGDGWGAATRLGPRVSNPGYGRLHAALALDGAGRALAGSLVGKVSTYSAVEGWSALDLGYDLARASVAMADSGHAIVVSEVTGGADSKSYLDTMRATRFTPEAGWAAPETIPVVPATPIENSAVPKSPSALDSSGVDVVINDTGKSIVVWHQAGNPTVRSRFSVWVAHYSPAMGWRAPTPLAVDQNIEAAGPRVAIDDLGRGIAIWGEIPVEDDSWGPRRLMWSRFE
jgi:hypothetical protein